MESVLYNYITNPVTGRPWPLLYQKDNSHLWICRNQMSTYELISKVVCFLTHRPARATLYDENRIFDEICSSINTSVTENTTEYGLYANTNSWSPVMTNDQLISFCQLVFEEWKRHGEYRYLN